MVQTSFRHTGTGTCECDGMINTVNLCSCCICGQMMCIKCITKHSICSSLNSQVGKQSEIHCRPDMFPLATLKVAEVCFEGNAKYDADNPMLDTIGPISPNWHLITTRDHINHALYHIYKQLSGDTSGEDHIAHAACRMMFALEMHLKEGKESKCPKCQLLLEFNTKKCDNILCDWGTK